MYLERIKDSDGVKPAVPFDGHKTDFFLKIDTDTFQIIDWDSVFSPVEICNPAEVRHMADFTAVHSCVYHFFPPTNRRPMSASRGRPGTDKRQFPVSRLNAHFAHFATGYLPALLCGEVFHFSC